MLMFAKYGLPSDIPLFNFHGLSGSQLEAAPLDSDVLAKAGISLIAPDRPGMISDRLFANVIIVIPPTFSSVGTAKLRSSGLALLLQDFVSEAYSYVAILRPLANGQRTPKEIAGNTDPFGDQTGEELCLEWVL